MIKRVGIVIAIGLAVGIVWYAQTGTETASTSYYDPAYENFSESYALLSDEEKNCLVNELGGVRTQELATLTIELNETEKAAIQKCTY